jgi:CcmD family protein
VIRVVSPILVVVLLMILAPQGSLAQSPDTPVSSDATAPAATAEPYAAPAADGFAGVEAAGVADRSAPPRTLRAYWHVFIAFALTWLLLFGYAISLGRRWARLEKEVLARQDG